MIRGSGLVQTLYEYAKIRIAVRILLGVWVVLFLLWTDLLDVGWSALGRGHPPMVQLYAWTYWTFPVSIVLAFVFHRKLPFFVLLPALNVWVWFECFVKTR
jgi:hypothetical protein